MALNTGIRHNYASDWGVWEGVREFVQNAQDAHEDGHRATYELKNNCLIVTNKNVVIPSAALLLGYSVKSRSARGRHGDGLKTGMLALVRAGHPVEIYNGENKWTPEIEASEEYGGERVLVVNQRKLRVTRTDFTVVIHNIGEAVWAALRARFLFLDKPIDFETLTSSIGTVLLSPQYEGCLFVKGIFVAKIKDLAAGYDFNDMDLDRDRRVVDSWSLRYKLNEVWQSLVQQHGDILYRQLRKSDSSHELHGLSNYADSGLAKRLQAELIKEYGDTAVAVTNIQDSEDAKSLGLTPVSVNTSLAKLIGTNISELKEARRKDVAQRWEWDSLNDKEKEVMHKIAIITSLDEMAVVSFHGDALVVVDANNHLLVSREFLTKPMSEIVREIIRREAEKSGKSIEDLYLTLLGYVDAKNYLE